MEICKSGIMGSTVEAALTPAPAHHPFTRSIPGRMFADDCWSFEEQLTTPVWLTGRG